MNEEGETACAPGGAYFNGGTGGVSAPFQTLGGTVGVGNPVPAGSPESGELGSGDRFDDTSTSSIQTKK